MEIVVEKKIIFFRLLFFSLFFCRTSSSSLLMQKGCGKRKALKWVKESEQKLVDEDIAPSIENGNRMIWHSKRCLIHEKEQKTKRGGEEVSAPYRFQQRPEFFLTKFTCSGCKWISLQWKGNEKPDTFFFLLVFSIDSLRFFVCSTFYRFHQFKQFGLPVQIVCSLSYGSAVCAYGNTTIVSSPLFSLSIVDSFFFLSQAKSGRKSMQNKRKC